MREGRRSEVRLEAEREDTDQAESHALECRSVPRDEGRASLELVSIA